MPDPAHPDTAPTLDDASHTAPAAPAVTGVPPAGATAADADPGTLPETLVPDRHAAPAPAGPEVPGFEVLAELGRGGMGVVYRARHVALGRVVALKMVLAGEYAGRRELERFRLEARAVAQLSHPNIVQVYEVGEAGGRPYFAMEFVAGGSLAERLAGTPQPPRAAAALVEQLARAMHAAHRAGVVHRDLKPANVLLAPDAPADGPGPAGDPPYGTPKVTDFGLAKHLGGETAHTSTGAVMGTPSYMAPEQARGDSKGVGPAADVYALGAVLYEMLTGRPPFKAATSLDTVMQVLRTEPVPPRRLQPAVPPQLETVCLKCLEKEPARRYPSAEALADDLRRFLAQEPISARAVGALGRGWRWCRRNPVVASLLAAVALSLVLGMVATTVFALRANANAARADEKAAEAAAGERAARRSLYVARMQLAQSAWQDANVGRLLELLDDAPPEGGEDLRGFEWHYLRRLCEGSLGVFRGPAGAVNAVAFSPDGARLAGAAADGTARVWDAATGRQLLALTGHAAAVTDVAFSPDGRRLATASADGTARVWDAASGAERFALRGADGEVTAVAFSPDGTRLATAERGGLVRTWDAATGAGVGVLRGHTGEVSGLAFGPDGRRLVTGSRDGTARLWDVGGGRTLFTLQGHKDMVLHVAFAPDGRRVATASMDRTVKVWDAETGREVVTLFGHGERVWGVAFSPDGRRLASASFDRTVRVWDVRTGEELLALKGHADGATRVAFRPDGRRLASGGLDRTARLWDSDAGQEYFAVRTPARSVHAVAFSPDGRGLAAAGDDNRARVWDPDTGAALAALPEFSAESAVAFARGRLAGAGGSRAAVWDVGTGKEAVALRPGESLLSVAFSPDGTRVGGGTSGGAVRVWDARGGETLFAVAGHRDKVFGAAFSPDGGRLATASADKTARVWDVASGRELVTLNGHTDWVRAVAFDPGGTVVATASADRTVRVWDVADGRELVALRGHTDVVTGVAFTPDGARLASSSLDRTVRLWDWRAGQEVLSLKGEKARFWGVAFDPDGRRLAAAGDDGVVRVWEAGTLPEEVRLRREAAALVGALFNRLGLRDEVLDRLRHDPSLPEPLRREALAGAARRPHDPDTLRGLAWEAVKSPGAAAARGRAAAQAEEACRLAPDDGSNWEVLGAARYREGRYAEALKALDRADRLARQAGEKPDVSDLAIRAMTRHRLGHKAEAQALLARLREALKAEGADEEDRALGQEAESVLREPPGR